MDLVATVHTISLLVVSSPWIFHSQVPISSLERTLWCCFGESLPFHGGSSMKTLVSPTPTASSSPLAGLLTRRAETLVASPCLTGAHRSLSTRRGIRACCHGDPGLPGLAQQHLPTGSVLFADSPTFAYSAPAFPDQTCCPSPPSGFFGWPPATLCPLSLAEPWKAFSLAKP